MNEPLLFQIIERGEGYCDGAELRKVAQVFLDPGKFPSQLIFDEGANAGFVGYLRFGRRFKNREF